MKKFLLLAFAMFSFLVSSATVMAGDISFTHISGNTYKVTVQLYGDTATTLLHCELILDGGDTLKRINGPSLYCSNSHDGEKITSCLGKLLYSVYEGEITFPGDGTYSIFFDYPNRAAGTCNIPNSVNTSFSLKTEIVINSFLNFNSAPVYTNVPVICPSIGNVKTYNPLITEMDGDSLYYELVPAMANGMNIPGYSYPAFSSNFNIDHQTGTVTWNTPVMVCQYVFDIKISEWRKLSGTGNYYYIGSSMQEIWSETSPSSGIEENQNTLSIIAYPNPSESTIYLNIQNNPSGCIVITDALGQPVKTIPLTENADMEIPIAGLSSGIYFYDLISSGKALKRGKFVISNASLK